MTLALIGIAVVLVLGWWAVPSAQAQDCNNNAIPDFCDLT